VSVFERNRTIYEAPEVVRHYARTCELQPAERTILAELADDLPHSSVLDIGVGGGRTTAHVGQRAKKYVAIDYAPRMISAARARYAHLSFEFLVADARAMPFTGPSFDVALFSHNGIDYVDHEDRLRVFDEVHRVLFSGGLFVFSTHNLDRDDLEFVPRPQEGLFRRARHALHRARLRKHNPDYRQLRSRAHAMVNDGVFGFRAATYHVRLHTQVQQLQSAGFDNVRVFSGVTGSELVASPTCRPPDPWLYFTCRRP
jgi:ubiquinone/menaquinone biosynthesis C-methylase UbiE